MIFLPFQVLGNRSNIEKMDSNVNLNVAYVNFILYFNITNASPLKKRQNPVLSSKKILYIYIRPYLGVK